MIQIPSVGDFTYWENFQDKGDLMERACNAFVEWFTQQFGTKEKVGIVCGTGNNGGDGLGIARLLKGRGYNVSVWIIKSEKQSEGFKANRERLPKDIPVVEVKNAAAFYPIHESILIDAIFGIGLTRPVEGIYAEIVRKFNLQKAFKIAVDVPSGLIPDKPSSGDIIKADHTVTFIAPKLALMFPQYAEFVGDWHMEGLGPNVDFHGFFYDERKPFNCDYYLDDRSVYAMMKRRKKFSHKGDFGRSLLVAGSLGKMGACVLAARAVLRSGAGLLTVHVPKCGYNIIQTSVPEAMATIDVGEDYMSDAGDASNYDVIGIGPGIGITSSTVSGLRKALQSHKPMVIDADALNILAGSRELMSLIPPGSILTPHPGEFKRLAGEWKDDFERLSLQKQLAFETKSVVILKGAHTSIADPGGLVYFNSTGNPGMAKGGSGDVLTGVLTGLLAQKYGAREAAIIGVYIHGKAGDLAATRSGQNSMLAGDIVDFLGQAFRH